MLVFQRTVDRPPVELNEIVSCTNAAQWRGKAAGRWLIQGFDFDRLKNGKWRVRGYVRLLPARRRIGWHVQEGFETRDIDTAVDFRRITFGRLLKRKQVAA